MGLAKNARLIIRNYNRRRPDMSPAARRPRVFRECCYQTLESWSRERRVVGKAEQRGHVSSLPSEEYDARTLYEDLYCARGDMENRIKEQQLAHRPVRQSVVVPLLCRSRLRASVRTPPGLLQGGRTGTYQRAQGVVGFAESYPYAALFRQVLTRLQATTTLPDARTVTPRERCAWTLCGPAGQLLIHLHRPVNPGP